MTKIYLLNGPEQGRSYEIDKDLVTIGRSKDNDIQILDQTVSRRHLEIIRRGDRYFLKDLNSLNGTFFEGKYLPPGDEVELREGSPIVLGMSVICVGRGCLEHVMPFLDSIELTRDSVAEGELDIQYRSKTNQKIMELIYKVSAILEDTSDIRRALTHLLDNIFAVLKRIDRAVIVLTDPVTGRIVETLARDRRGHRGDAASYSREVVETVLKEKKAVVVPDAESFEQREIADTLKLSKIASVLCVPILSGSQVRGAVYVDSIGNPYSFRQRDLALFADLGRRAGIAIENALLKESLEHN